MATVASRRDVRFAADIAADLTDMAVARDALADALHDCAWNEEDAFRVLICADEAMANAVSHGSTPTDTIGVRFRVGPAAASVVIEDQCAGVAHIPSPTVPADTSEHGRGLMLMQVLADAFRIQRRPAGTRVALAFRATEGCAQ